MPIATRKKNPKERPQLRKLTKRELLEIERSKKVGSIIRREMALAKKIGRKLKRESIVITIPHPKTKSPVNHEAYNEILTKLKTLCKNKKLGRYHTGHINRFSTTEWHFTLHKDVKSLDVAKLMSPILKKEGLTKNALITMVRHYTDCSRIRTKLKS